MELGFMRHLRNVSGSAGFQPALPASSISAYLEMFRQDAETCGQDARAPR